MGTQNIDSVKIFSPIWWNINVQYFGFIFNIIMSNNMRCFQNSKCWFHDILFTLFLISLLQVSFSFLRDIWTISSAEYVQFYHNNNNIVEYCREIGQWTTRSTFQRKIYNYSYSLISDQMLPTLSAMWCDSIRCNWESLCVEFIVHYFINIANQ